MGENTEDMYSGLREPSPPLEAQPKETAPQEAARVAVKALATAAANSAVGYAIFYTEHARAPRESTVTGVQPNYDNNLLYPLTGERAERNNGILDISKAPLTEQVIHTLIDAAKRGEQPALQAFSVTIPMFIQQVLCNEAMKQATQDENDPQSKWWEKIQARLRTENISFGTPSLETGQANTDQAAKKNTPINELYIKLINQTRFGNVPATDEDLKIIAAVEGMRMTTRASMLIDAVRQLRQRFDITPAQLIELQLGETPNRLISRCNEILQALSDASNTNLVTDKPQYFVYMAELVNKKLADTKALPSSQDKPDQEALEKVFELLHINKQELEKLIVIMHSTIASAVFLECPTTPIFPDSITQNPAYQSPDIAGIVQKLAQAKALLVLSPTTQGFEAIRQLVHEIGHTIPTILQSRTEQGELPLTIVKPLYEIFSLFLEVQMQPAQYAFDRWNLLAKRFAALTIHEMQVWQFLDQAAQNTITQEEFIRLAKDSYQTTLGDAFGVNVIPEMALTDYMLAVPGNPSSYVISLIPALCMQAIVAHEIQLDAYDTPASVTALLTKVATVAQSARNVDQILEVMNLTWEQALQIAVQKLNQHGKLVPPTANDSDFLLNFNY